MIPNRIIILWDDTPVAVDEGYPFKTSNPSIMRFWSSVIDAQNYLDVFKNTTDDTHYYGFYQNSKIVEVEFVIHEIQNQRESNSAR